MGAVVALWIGWALGSPVHGESRTVDIPSRTTRSQVAQLLANAGVVRSRLAFLLVTAWKHSGVRAGEYEVNSSEGLLAVIAKLHAGKVKLHAFTVPEGFTADQIARSLESKGLGSAERFRAAIEERDLLSAHGVPGPTAEGYLFPDTYRIPRGLPERELAQTMLRRFDQLVPASKRREASAIALSFHQALTLASIVEHETARAEERPIVAAVFLNRLRARMRLESCACVWYALDRAGRAPAAAAGAERLSGAGIPRGSGKLSLADLDVASPYNTYRHGGLPPGPIGSPGLASIEAALHPANVPFLFFVARGNGTHDFAVSYDEFLKDKLAMKRRRRAPGRSATP